jgi:photosystem II stability/assembly factor-like uncharacterized protein
MDMQSKKPRRWYWFAPAALLGLILVVVLAACGNVGQYQFGTVQFADQQNGWVTGWNETTQRAVVSKTTDGGQSWVASGSRKTNAPAGVVGWVAFSSPATGVWCCDSNRILYTTTGGSPWKRATIRRFHRWHFGGYFTRASFVDPHYGWASAVSGNLGVVAKTRNGGRTWFIKLRTGRKAYPGGFTDVVALGRSSCLALKNGWRHGVWATTDNGKTWTRHALPGATRASGYTAMAFPTPLVGYAVGPEGMIAKTTDGGVTWSSQKSGVETALYDVTFVGADSGYAVGAGGVILATTTGGEDWVGQTSGTTDDLFTVDFISDDEGWIVGKPGWVPGQSGTLLHTMNAGAAWTPQ